MKILLLINLTCYYLNISLWEARMSISRKNCKESHIPQIGYMEFENAAHSYRPFLSFPPPQLPDKSCSQASEKRIFTFTFLNVFVKMKQKSKLNCPSPRKPCVLGIDSKWGKGKSSGLCTLFHQMETETRNWSVFCS